MTIEEFGYFAAGLRTFYPKENMLPTTEAVRMWYDMLKDLDAGALTTALKKWVQTEKWPPSIADLRSMCSEVEAGKLPDWGEGWAEVVKAVHRYGWSRPQEALNSLPPLAKRAATLIGWEQICISENPEALRAQFRQLFESSAKREQEDRQISGSVKELIDGIKTQLAESNFPQLGE